MYAEYYGLTAEPFLLTPDEKFYFDSSVHAQAMAHLVYGVEQSEGFIVITGDVGAGKTTLVKRLLATIDKNQIVAAHVVTTLVEGTDLLRMVTAAFGLKDLPKEKSALLLQLHRLFEAVSRIKRRALLIVDEAQNLSVSALEELRMLSNFQAGNGAPFQSFLIGQPEFRRTLRRPELEQLRQRVIASYHLGPMSLDECGAYLAHRLTQVGWTKNPDFDASAVEAIYRYSGGIPRRINTICSRLMLLGFLDELHRFSADEVERVVADLANEGFMLPKIAGIERGAPDQSESNGAGIADAGIDMMAAGESVQVRLARLEQTAARQEKALMRIALAAQDLLRDGGSSDPESGL